MKCRPVESSLTSPNTTTCRCGFRMSARKAWFIQVQRIDPLASAITAWKIRNPRRLVIARFADLDLAQHRRLGSRPERGDRLHAAAVFVAKRQAVQQVLDGDEARAFEVGRLARTDTLQELKRSGERIR